MKTLFLIHSKQFPRISIARYADTFVEYAEWSGVTDLNIDSLYWNIVLPIVKINKNEPSIM